MAVSNLLPQLVFSFIAALFLVVVHAEQDTISFNVTAFTENPTWLTYQGDAGVASGTSFLRLTRTSDIDSGPVPSPYSVGRVLFTTQVQFWESAPAPRQASFQTDFTFNITASPNGAADGLAFFIAPVGSVIPLGSSGENLGIFGPIGQSHGLFAVEFDNYVNSQFDPAFPHIGIDLNSKTSKDTTRFLDLGEVQQNGLVTARVTYDAPSRQVTVNAAVGSRTFTVNYITDLKETLPQRVQVGISSATGDPNEGLGIYDLLSWSFTSSLVPDN